MNPYLREDDPEYSEDEDSILATLSCFDHIGFEDENDNYDYKDPGGWFLPFRHCALFHALYDHIFPRLHWGDILRIGTVWVDIKVDHQKQYDLETGELIRDNGIREDENGLHHKLKE